LSKSHKEPIENWFKNIIVSGEYKPEKRLETFKKVHLLPLLGKKR